jgi:hypothetical protein
LRHAPIPSVPGLFAFGSLQGRKALPGTYQVRVTAGSATATQSIEVAQDPRLGDRSADLAAQEAFLVIADRELAEIHQAVVRLRAVRQQLEDLRVRLRDSGRLTAGSSLAASGRALVDRLTAIEERLVQPRTTDGQTVLNFGMRLNQYYIYLRAAVDNGETGVTDGARQRLADLSAEWARHRAALATALGDELGAFNTLVLEAGVPAVVVPPGR